MLPLLHVDAGDVRAQVYALTKERDALRRNSERLNSATDLVKEKDAIIQQARQTLQP